VWIGSRTALAQIACIKMADVILKKGALEVTFDFENVTIKEFRSLFDKDQTADDEDYIVGKVAGLTVDEVQALSHPDYKRLMSAFWKRSQDPINDPKN
jgi:hypothetical protein